MLNLGVRFRQVRVSQWLNPGTLAAELAFGLCSGTDDPYGSADPRHFLGVRTQSPWSRVESQNWFQIGWEIFTAGDGTESTHASGTGGTMRVSTDDDSLCSAWYLRFEKGVDTMRVELFQPATFNLPLDFDFEMQMDRFIWNRSVGNHDDYREFAADVPFDESLGDLDSVNIYASPPDFVTSQLRSIEWLNIRAVRIE